MIIDSINKVPIRLTDERWNHITTGHHELTEMKISIVKTIEDPDIILEGYQGALMAVRKISEKKWIVVIYKEVSKNDGFIITAFLTTKNEFVETRRKIYARNIH